MGMNFEKRAHVCVRVVPSPIKCIVVHLNENLNCPSCLAKDEVSTDSIAFIRQNVYEVQAQRSWVLFLVSLKYHWNKFAQIGCGVSIFEGFQNLKGHSPEHPAVVDLDLSRVVEVDEPDISANLSHSVILKFSFIILWDSNFFHHFACLHVLLFWDSSAQELLCVHHKLVWFGKRLLFCHRS